jgi:Tfp pilus assembly protein PilX
MITLNKQKGVALVVGLVMLLVLTIMGISSMSNTTLQLKIAGNTQCKNVSFQTSLSGTEFALRSNNLRELAIGEVVNFNYQMPNSCETATGTVQYTGCMRKTGGSLDTSSSTLVYQVNSTGVDCSGVCSTQIVQAVGMNSPTSCADDS